MINGRRKSVGDRRHRWRIQTPIEIEGWSLTEPEDAGFDASRKLGAKGKPEDATAGESRRSTRGQIRKADGRCESVVGWKVKSEDAGSDEESGVGLEGRTGGCEFRRESEVSSKVKLEDWSSGASRGAGPKAKSEGWRSAQVDGWLEGTAGRFNIR